MGTSNATMENVHSAQPPQGSANESPVILEGIPAATEAGLMHTSEAPSATVDSQKGLHACLKNVKLH